MQPDRATRREYVEAFRELVNRIAVPLASAPKRMLPIQMYVAGGAALHFYTGERVSEDIDAAFSRRIALPENLELGYRDADGATRVLYLDRNYNDTLGLLHEDAYEDSEPLALDGIDARVLDIRLLSPLDLAVGKLGRFAEQDRDDIAALARRGLITSRSLRIRAQEALAGYVGDTARVQGSIDIACRIVEDIEKRAAKSRK